MKTALQNLKNATSTRHLLIVVLTLTFATGTLKSNAQCSLPPNFTNTIYSSPVTTSIRGVCTGDFNNDGYLDWAACTQSTPGKIVVYLNNGAGGFTEAPGSGFANSVSATYVCIATGDFNNDGILDLVVSSESTASIFVYFGNGDGSFKSQYLQIPMLGANCRTVVTGDFNHDGNTDIAATSSNTAELGKLAVFLGNGNGTFQSRADYPMGIVPGGGAFWAATADLDNDGNTDIVYGNENAYNVAVVYGNGSGGFVNPVVLTPLAPGGTTEMVGVAIADFNGDGKPDIVGCNTSQNYVDVWLNTGSRTFNTHTHYLLPASPYGIVAADFNNDGKIDLVTNNTNSTMTVLLGNGNGTFSTTENFAVGSDNSSYIATADFNRDGRPDIVETNQGSSNAYVWLNTTAGASAVASSPVCPGGTISLTATGPAGATGYHWAGPNGFVSNTQNPTISSASSLKAGVYNLTVTATGGCTDYASTSAVVVTVASASASSTSLCSANTLRLFGGPSAMASYAWSGPNSFSSTLQSPSIVNPSVGSGAFTLKVTDANGCTSSASTPSVTVNASVTTAGVIGGTASVCAGQSGIVYSTTAIPNAVSYVWTLPSGASGSSTSASITVNFSGSASSGNITVAGVAAGSCGAGPVATFAVAVSSPPSLTGNQTLNCVGATTSFGVSSGTGGTVTNVGGYYIHTFTVAGTTTGVSTGTTGSTSYTFTPAVSGLVDFLVIGGGGGGGSYNNAGNGGGGGAGGYRCSVVGELSGGGATTTESQYAVTAGVPVAVSVGGGGNPNTSTTSVNNGVSTAIGNGNPSTFGTITSYGGAVGGNYSAAAVNGGSGGGAGQNPGTSTVATGTSLQGKGGGASSTGSGYAGAGGGGAAANGANDYQIGSETNGQEGGYGGIGITSSITGTAVGRGGGGAGAAHAPATAGVPCGGSSNLTAGTATAAAFGGGNGHYSTSNAVGATWDGTSGTDGTGGGGGGGGDASGNPRAAVPGNGGAGIVIVRYPSLPAGGTWASSNSTIATVNGSGVVTAAGAGTANITYTYTNSCSQPVTLTRSVTVNSTATATASATSPVCSSGTNSTLTLTGSPAGQTYVWSGPNGFTSSAQSPVIANPTTAAAGTYTLTAVTSNGCSATATASAVVNSPALTTNSLFICAGQSITVASHTYTTSGTYIDKVLGSGGSCDNVTITKLKVLYGNGVTNFKNIALPTGLTGASSPRAVALGDVNGDGNQDLVAVSYADAKVQVFLGDGNGGFTLASTAAIISPASTTIGVAVADLNGDGRADVITANGSNNTISVFTGNADGSLTLVAGSPIAMGGTVNTVTVGDFNNDGKLDIAAGNASASTVFVMLGNGNGTFGSISTYSNGTGTTTYGIITADFNGDGNLDLATANQGGGALSVLLGNGNGTFNAATNYASVASGTPISLTSGDFNRDGIPDIAVGNYGSAASVTIFLGNGNGTFPSAGSSTTLTGSGGTNQVYSLVSGDFDGDGLVDLATADNSANDVRILSGNGDGTFNAASGTKIISVGGTPQGIVSADFNNDGRPDLIVATTALGTRAVTELLNYNGYTSASYTGGLCTTGTNTLSLQSNPSANGGSAYSYTWQGPGGFSSTMQNPTAIPSPTTGTYSLTVSSPTNFCASNATVAVVVSSNPTATASTTGAACTNSNLTFAGGPANMTSYSWSGPNSFASTSQNPVLSSPSTLYSGVYTLTVTDVNGCTATASTSSITVNAYPTLTPVTASTCFSAGAQNVNLGYTSTGSPDTYSITNWSGVAGFNNVVNAVLDTPIVVSVPAGAPAGTGSTTYSGIITVLNSATGCAASTGTTNLVTINALPFLTVSPASGISSCSGTNVTLTASGATTYTWSPATYLSATVGSSVTVSSPTSSVNYTVTGTNISNGCSATAPVSLVYSTGLTGTYTIDNTVSGAGNLYPNTTTFNSFTSAIAALNCLSGPVTFNVVAGESFKEYPITSTFTNPGNYAIVFKNNGTPGTNNPVLQGTNGVTSNDAIIKFVSINNLTMNGIDLMDNPANNNNNLDMDYGLWFLGANTAGCFNNTYENGNITLSKTNTNITYGIYLQSQASSNAAGENSNNSFLNDNIKYCVNAYFILGYGTTYPDQNNQIGTTGNGISSINNLGNNSSQIRGIYYQNEQNFNIFNTNISFTNNTTQTDYGIYANSGTNTTVNIYGNTLSLATTNTSGPITGIQITSGVGMANIYNNTFTNFYSAGSSLMTGIYYAGYTPFTNIIANNLFSSFTQATTGQIYGIEYVCSYATNTCNIYSNTLTGFTNNANLNYGIYENTGQTSDNLNIYNNVVSNFTSTYTAGSPYGIFINSSTGTSSNLYGNTVSSITNTLATAGSVYGIDIANGNINNVYNNLVTGIASTVPSTTASTIIAVGLNYLNNTATNNNIYGNTISNVSTSSATTSNNGQTSGMIIGGNQICNIFRNVINNISSATTTTGRAVGLQVSNTSNPVSTFNNMIYDIRGDASTSGAPGGAVGLYISATSGQQKVYYNTVYLNSVASGAVAQISTAFYSNIFTTTDFRNNIWINNYTPTTSASSYAYAQWFNTTTMANTITNNLLYAGTTSGTHNYLFFNTTTRYQTLATYKTATNMSGKGDATLSQTLTASLPSFFVSSTSPYNVHLNGNPSDAYQKGSTNLGAPWTTDIDGDARAASGNTTIGADEPCVAASIIAPVINGNVAPNVCQGTGNTVFSVPAVTGVLYNWSIPAQFPIIAGESNNSVTVTFPSATPATTYTVSVTEVNGCTSSTTASLPVVVQPAAVGTGTITGSNFECPSGSNLTYSTSTVSGAVTYTWNVPATIGTIASGQSTSSITVTPSASPSGGNITVVGVSACGTSGTTSPGFAVANNTATPASAGISSPNGGGSECPGATGVIYSAQAITGATGYTWTVPGTLGTISGASNGQSITVTISPTATSGNITVAGINQCGTANGASSSPFPVLIPSTTIGGSATITCLGSTTQLFPPAAASATGGTVSYANGYTIHTFSLTGTNTGVSTGTTSPSTSTFTFTPSTNMTVQYLVIGGGGSAGAGGGGLGGGGGAGGYRCSVPGEFSGGLSAAETPLSLTGGVPYTVVVGAGGGVTANGQNSSISQGATALVTSYGGGSGGTYDGNANTATCGSGGGGGQNDGGYGPAPGIGTAGQGFNGGTFNPATDVSQNCFSGCGGGGAGAVGKSCFKDSLNLACEISNNWQLWLWDGGAGGNGIQSGITGTSTYRGGGGAGGSHWYGNIGPALGGLGGGGNGKFGNAAGGANACGFNNTFINSTAGVDGTGGGGGASGDGSNGGSSSAGGAGIVIIRYPTPALGTWSSDNTAVATVNSSGVVTGLSVGSCNISYTVPGGSCPYVATTALTVSNSPFNATASANPTMLCQNSNTAVTLSATVGYAPQNNLPIVISNSTGTATSANFPVELIINFLTYAGGALHANLDNLEFTTGPGGGGTPLYAWIENGSSASTTPATLPTSSSTAAVVWVNLGSTIIPANGSTTIYMNFEGSAVMVSSGVGASTGYTGMAPQLTGSSLPNYGMYDNGALVFTGFYDNFAGTTLNASNWTSYTGNASGGNGTTVVNNGITITGQPGANSVNLITSVPTFTGNFFAETYVSGSNAQGANRTYQPALIMQTATAQGSNAVSTNTSIADNGPSVNCMAFSGGLNGQIYYACIQGNSTSNYESTEGGYEGNPYPGYNIIGLGYNSGGTDYWYANYSPITSTASYQPTGSLYYSLGVGNDVGGTAASFTAQWARIRIAPPAGTMPTYAFIQSINSNNASYSWTGPNGFTSSLQNPAPIVNPSAAASGVYTVTASNGSCSGSASTTTVTVYSAVTTKGVISGPATVCSGTTVTYSTSIPNAGSYYWTVPSDLGTIVGPSTGSSINVNILASPTADVILLAGVPEGGCGYGPFSYLNVGINPTPPAPVITTTNGGVICSGETGVVYSLTPVPNVSSYSWSVPASVGAIVGPSTGTSITVTAAGSPTGGTIKVSCITICGTASPDTGSYVVNPPTPVVLTGVNSLTCGNGTTQFSVPSATGGTITTSGGYYIHTFTTSGTTNSSYTFTPSFSGNVDFLVIGGGGSGSTLSNGNDGGGGAGGYRCSVAGELSGGGAATTETQYAVTAGVPVTVVVGGGGSTANTVNNGITTDAGNGNPSSFGTIVSYGGGDAGGYSQGVAQGGGSGGGVGQNGGSVASGTSLQGNAGGNITGSGYAGGGGGGAGAPGQNDYNFGSDANNGEGGYGGIGITSTISGSPVGRGGGGGGSSHNVAVNGPSLGGGWNGTAQVVVPGGYGGGVGQYLGSNSYPAGNGVDGTGGGGGGGGNESGGYPGNPGGNGGAGIVIVRYPNISGGTWASSNSAVATVNSSGLVTTHSNGSATISYTYTPANSTCELVSTRTVTIGALTASASATTPVCSGGGQANIVPIVINNSQSTATSANLPVMLSVNFSTYASGGGLNANLNNLEFTTGPGGTGTPLYAWIENGSSATTTPATTPTSSSTAATVWVNLGSTTVPANGSVTIYMNFLGSTVMTGTTGYIGMAPQLSGTYGQYDNGALVFPTFYDNFAGSTLDAKWGNTYNYNSYSTLTVNNGLTLAAPALGTLVITSANSYAPPYIAEAYTQNSASVSAARSYSPGLISGTATAEGVNIVDAAGPPPVSYIAWSNGRGSYVEYTFIDGTPTSSSPYADYDLYNPFSSFPSGYNVYGIGYNGTANTGFQNYSLIATGTSTYSPSGKLYFTLGLGNYNYQPTSLNAYWTRIRTYPPGGVMPTYAFSAAISSNSTINLSETDNAGTPTYSWKGPNGFTSSIQSPLIIPPTLSTASAGIYTLTVTDGTCSTGLSVTTNSVVVNPTVTATGTIVGSSIVCANLTGVVYSTAPIANATSYLWTVPSTLGTISGTSTGNSITVTIASSPVAGSITVAGVSTGGCGNGPTAPLAVGVNTALPPSAGITAISGVSVCAGATGQVYSAAPITGATGYVWTVPGTLGTITSGQGTNSITVTIAGVGIATGGDIKVAGINVCGTTSTSTAKITITIPATQVTGIPIITCLGATTQLNAPAAQSATGGTVTTGSGLAAGYIIHTFTSSGTFTPTVDMTGVQYLVVAGGGSGGWGGGPSFGVHGGGGGAGGLRSSVPADTSGGGGIAEAPVHLIGGTPYVVTVGAGGNGSNNGGVQGGNSSFDTITAYGGGYGGTWQACDNTGRPGGCGGGAGQAGGCAVPGYSGNVNPATGLQVEPVQGYRGGGCSLAAGAGGGGGGGGTGARGDSSKAGGAVVPGGTLDGNEGANGGRGITSSISGSRIFYGGGGGGSSHGNSTLGVPQGYCIGGSGIGGNGAYGSPDGGPPYYQTPATDGAANTGSGGGGVGTDALYGHVGQGGSGIVIIRYATAAPGVWSSDNTAIATVSNTGLVTAISAGVDTIRFTVTSGACPYVNKIPVTVSPLVSPLASYTPPTCIGGTLALRDTGDSGSGITYSWNGPNSFSSSIQNPSISPLTSAAAGIYTVTATKGTCTESTTTNAVVVNTNPVPSITESDNSGNVANDNRICNLDAVTLTGLPASNVTYKWSAGLGTTQVVVDNPSVSTTYTLTVTDLNGCTATATTSIVVDQLPPVLVTPASAVCTGLTTAVLTASGASSYTWSPTANLTTTNGGITETAQISALTFYTITGTDGNDCSASVVVPIATVPTGGTVSPIYSIICSGGTKTLTVTGEAGHDYQWQISTDDVNWTNITGATNTTYTTASGDGNSNKFYRLMAQSNSCWNVASTTGEVDVSNPNIVVTATNVTDNSLTLNWSPTGTGNYSISYSGPSSATTTSVTPPKTITGLSSDGTYSVTVTQTGVTGCPASGTITGEDILCAMPTGVTLSSPAPAQIQVSWTGTPGADYRVYYRPLFSYTTYFTKDVSNASSVLLTKQGANNIYASTTYEVYVSRLDCPTTGVVGQGTNPTNVTTLPTVTCVTPVIDSVRSLCPVQIEVFIHDNGVNQYNVFLQRVTPSILAVNSYGVSGTYFTINTPYSGDQYIIAVEARCGSALSSVYVYPGNVTVKPLCNAPTNLVLSNPTCHGFTASWNSDECLSNSASAYDFYLREAGTINYNSYGVPLPGNGIGPHELLNFLAAGRTYQVFVRSVYNCNGFVTYGPTSQVETTTTLSSGCRDEDAEQPQENKPATQQYAPDNSEVFSLYPNPNTGKFVVDLSRLNMEEDAVRIEVINMLGQTVLTNLTTISGGHMSEYINLPGGTAAGTYIVRLTSGKNVYTTKVNISK